MSKKVTITVYALLSVLLIGVIAAAALIITDSREDRDKVVGELNDKYDALELEENRLEMSLSQSEAERSRLEAEKSRLESELNVLNEKLKDAGKAYSDEIEALKAEIESKSAEIAALEADIAKYRTVFNIDVRAQAQLIDEIILYIETACPYLRVTIPDPEFPDDPEKATSELKLITELIAEEYAKYPRYDAELSEEDTDSSDTAADTVKVEDNSDTDTAEVEEEPFMYPEPLFTEAELLESGLSEEEYVYTLLYPVIVAREDVSYPNVSVYYEDLATGYHFDYNADLAYNSASVIKAPYILSVLKAISADEQAYLAALSAENRLPEQIDDDGDGVFDRVKIEYTDPTYDLYERVVYTKEAMYKDGSGKIKDMEDGTEFNYIDFIKYTLEYSDNVAYQALRARFGFTRMTSLASKLKVSIAKNSMTARGAGILFKEIYKFTEEDETYGPLMAQSMAKGNHTVIIPYGVSPTKTLHKYGWDEDSYHDAAIVLHGDKPYVLAVFSDLDVGGNEVNLYLREIVKMINKLHKGFYSSK